MTAQAKTNNFMLGVAEVQIGPVADLFELTHAHSIGLVKNFTLTSDPSYVELTQGVKNTIVDSAQTNNAVRATMEAYEFTAANIKYALGLDGSVGTADNVDLTLQAGPADAATTVIVVGDQTLVATTGKWLVIEEGDTVYMGKIASSSLSTNTSIVLTGYPLPQAFTTAARISVMNAISIGSTEDQPYLSAKVIGVLSNGERIHLLIPKLRVVKGFSLAFTTENYGNMPIEFTPYELVSTDVNYGKMPSTSGTVFLFKQ